MHVWKYSLFLVAFLVVLSHHVFVNAEIDTTPPQLEIDWPGNYYNVPSSTIVINGKAYDESGIQRVTVNGSLVEKYGMDWKEGVNCFWQKTVDLVEGPNTIIVIAYDNSPNNNSIAEAITVVYKTMDYEGPTVKLIPTASQSANNATIKCIVNPNGLSTEVSLWDSYSSWEDAPFGMKRFVGHFSGTENVTVSFTFPEEDQLSVGETVSYLFTVKNSKGSTRSEIGTFTVSEPIFILDTKPPYLVFWPESSCNVPDSTIIIEGSAYDASGILFVTVNGELATGLFTENWFFWQKTINLTEGPNTITALAYDNSSNRFVSEKTITITYQPSGYQGPTIRLLPPVNVTSTSGTIRCVINPNGLQSEVYLYYSGSSVENAPFRIGSSLGYQHSGEEDIVVIFHLDYMASSESISYRFHTSNSEGWASTEVTILNLPPTKIILLDPTELTADSMKLVWTMNNDDDFYSYNVYQSNSPQLLGVMIFNTNDRLVTSKSIVGLSANTTYHFIVRVVDAGGEASDSNQINARTKIPTTISCSVSSHDIDDGLSITVSGAINPAIPEKSITLTYREPDGSILNRTVITGSDGSYNDSYQPNVVGSWSVGASWEGDDRREGTSSLSQSFIIKPVIKSFIETPIGIATIIGIVALIIIALIIIRKNTIQMPASLELITLSLCKNAFNYLRILCQVV
jgi:hypothetical protein